VLRPKPVVDRGHQAAPELAEKPSHAVVRFEAADHPTASVEINQHRTAGLGIRPVDPDADVATRARNGPVLDGEHVFDRSEHERRVAVV
jgi:hypothetical protein